MRPRAVYGLVTVLTKSQLRSSQRGKAFTKWFSKPYAMFAVDATLIAILGSVGYVAFSTIIPSEAIGTLQVSELQALTAIPTATSFSVILLGILTELSQSVQSANTDLVNWLPIFPSEYVAGSTLSISYTYSFIPSLLLGASLGPAIFLGQPVVWVASAVMSAISLFGGACVVELLRAITNRISSSFYKRSGRSGILLRLGLTIIVLVFFQLLFSGQIVVYVLRAIVQTVEAVWFVPVVWPSLAVQTLYQNGFIFSLLFGLLSLAFTSALFGLAVNFRAKYWVPVPVSIRLDSRPYHPEAAKVWMPGISSAELAIVRKDLRSLTRRREMARFLAIPFVLAASMTLSLYQIGSASASEPLGLTVTVPLYVIPIAVFCEVIAMTSIGQEGYAVWNIYVAPLKSGQFLKAKLLIATLLGLAFTSAILMALVVFVNPATSDLLLLFGLGVVVVLEESAFGLYVAARFPDFRENVRSRYVTIWGSLAGMLLGIMIALFTVTPLFFSALFGGPTIALTAAPFAIGILVFFIAWRMSERETKLLFDNIRI